MKALDKKRLMREIEKKRRAEVNARLAELRGLIRAEQVKRREVMQSIRLDCREQRIALRRSCHGRMDDARAQGAERIKARRGELARERLDEQLIREADRRGSRIRTTKLERRQESDDEVRGNISPELIPIFNQITRHIKGGPRRTRTEAFLEWVEENPGEVYAMQQRDADRWLAQLLAEQARLQKVKRKRGRAFLEAAPF